MVDPLIKLAVINLSVFIICFMLDYTFLNNILWPYHVRSHRGRRFIVRTFALWLVLTLISIPVVMIYAAYIYI